MSIVMRGVAGHNWGWVFGEECDDDDRRMHIQAMDRAGAAIRIWLEDRGKRVLEFAAGKDQFKSSELRTLHIEIETQRAAIERHWIGWMIARAWIRADVVGSKLVVAAYPGTRNAYTGTLDLETELPGAYTTDQGDHSYKVNPPRCNFDLTIALLAVGHSDDLDDRNHFEVSDLLFHY
jgi:hypothetical protein